MKLFPYSEIRQEQDELLAAIDSALAKKQHILVHAPTGLGKTAASLVPALEHALDKKLTVFFLTSRHTQHAIAIETLKKIKAKHDVKFVITDLIGKKHMCLQDGVLSFKSGEFHDYCRKLREDNLCEYYSNTKDNSKNSMKADYMLDKLKQLGPQDTEQLHELCKDEKMCPYEIATLLAKDSSVIIADYAYIFDTTARNSLFRRINKKLGECIVIIDEAHNLPKRIVDSATDRLTTFILKRAIQECNKYEYTETAVRLTKIMNSLTDWANELKNSKKEERLVAKKELLDVVNSVEEYESLLANLFVIWKHVQEMQKQTFLGSVIEFLMAWKGEDEGFTRIFSVKENKLCLSYKCLDPAVMSEEVISQTYCTIAMSGTLTPTDMYRDLLGFKNASERVFKSPFPVENKLSLIVPRTTTQFTKRSETQFENISNILADITNAIPGNCAVFFPSYSIRDSVFKHYSIKTNKTAILEVPDLSKQEKTEILEKFKSYSKVGAVLLGASTGSFAEGIDLKGDFLKCVVVVGLPLQQPDLETQEAIKYYDKKFGKGWDYAYVFPAFNKVLQGAGRCIRSETDRGVIVFLDERYSWPNYIRCFPEDMELKIKKDYLAEIKDFFLESE